jgi:hypothetical protein
MVATGEECWKSHGAPKMKGQAREGNVVKARLWLYCQTSPNVDDLLQAYAVEEPWRSWPKSHDGKRFA